MVLTSFHRLATVAVMTTALALGTAVVGVSPASADTPGNDNIANAMPLATDTTITASNVGATVESGENATPSGPGVQCSGGASVWYSLADATSEGRVHLHVDSASFDDVLTVWSSASPTPSFANGEGGEDFIQWEGIRSQTQPDLDVDLDPKISFNGGEPANPRYYFLSVDSCTSGAQGTVTLTTSYTARPSNDDLANAIPLTDGETVEADTRGASFQPTGISAEPFEVGPYGTEEDDNSIVDCQGGSSVWYVVPAGVKYLTISIPDNAPFDGFVGLRFDPFEPTGTRVQAHDHSPGTQVLGPGPNYVAVDSCNAYPGIEHRQSSGYSAGRPEGIVPFAVSFKAPAGATNAPIHTAYAGATKGVVSAAGLKGLTVSKGVTKAKVGHYTGYAATKKGQSIMLDFTGTRVDLHFGSSSADGKTLIFIDGTKHIVDLSGAGKLKDLEKTFAHLTKGKHVVFIDDPAATGKHGASAKSIRVFLTSLRIYS